MKLVIGLVLIALLVGALIIYLVLMLNAHSVIFCGDITNENGRELSVTRVYTSDMSANETLSEIVLALNTADGDNISVEEITMILAEYQSIIYAPVVLLEAEKIDSYTFVITGSVYNGIDDKGEPTQGDYLYDNLRMNVLVSNGEVLAAQNIYEDDTEDKKEEGTLVERNHIIEPSIYEDNTKAAFAFEETDSFRMIVQSDSELPAELTFVYTYDIATENPLDFTGMDDASLGIRMSFAYDEDGLFDPVYSLIKTEVIETKD